MRALSIPLLITLIALWQLTASPNSHATPLAQTRVEEAARAVVRVRGCYFTNCNASLGSGAIIHPSGIILTAWHVIALDSENQVTPEYFNDFIIEVTDDVRQAPQPRYRARVIATNAQDDLALLQIYQEEYSGRIIEQTTLDLPWLPISNVTPTSAELRLMGYPPNGGDAISYPTFDQSGFADNGTLLKVQATVSKGFSGGPALVERPGGFEIVGMAGNVWDWTTDWYDSEYNNSHSKNLTSPESGEHRVLRGGSWFNYPRLFFFDVGTSLRDYFQIGSCQMSSGTDWGKHR